MLTPPHAPGRLALAIGVGALLLTGALVSLGPLAPGVVVDARGDWRKVCVGCQRLGDGSSSLALAGAALVHFHGLDGRQQSLDLWLAARGAPVKLEVARSPEGPPLLTARLGSEVDRVRIRLARETRDLDLWLRASPGEGLPLVLREIELARSSGAFDRVVQWLPGPCGALLFLVLARRQPLSAALLLSLAGLVCLALAALALHDPLGFLELRPLWRERLQTSLAAALAAAALWHVPDRPRALLTLAATSWLLYLPSANNGLVSDDFLWARTWTLGDVALTYVGPEDPAGKSNVYYRPISATAHAVDAWTWGGFVRGYHVTNLALNALAGGAALALLERLGLSRRAALLGALAWIVHPMSASAVAWVSQRTDLIVSVFYLSSLSVLLGPRGRRGFAPLVPALLAFGSKEVAVSLPAVAVLAVVLFLRGDERRARLPALGGLALLAAAHTLLWINLFPEVAGHRLFGGAPGPSDDPVLRLLRGLLGVAASVTRPLGYEAWWKARLAEDWRVHLVACAVFPLLLLWLRRCPSCLRGSAAAAAAFGVAWAPVVALPMFGIRLLDLYRLGFLPCFAFALVAGAVAHHLEHGGARRPAALALALVVWLAPLALDTAEEWGPGGFYYEMSLTLERRLPDWPVGLSPLALGLYERQLAASDHEQQAADQLELMRSTRRDREP